MKYAIIAVKALLTLAFLTAGGAKLIGAEMMVGTFEAVGVGQWFRYVTGLIEVGGAILLWVRGREAWGAGFLLITMVGAIFAHVLILGPSAIPAIVLGIGAAFILWTHRDQLSGQAATA
jgi:hypothetical protein